MDKSAPLLTKTENEIPTRMWIAAFLVSQPSFLFGYATAALNACLVVGDGDSVDDCYHNTDDESNNCPPGTIYNDINLNTLEAEIATSLLVLGAWIGCLLGSAPSEKYGRRLTILGNNIFFISGAALCCVSNDFALYVGRFICGLGVGVESVVVPVLLSEIASPETRGTITTLHQLQITFGIFVAGILGFAFVNYVVSGWVYVQAVIAIPAILMIVCSALVPESPKWLLARNRRDDAMVVMKSLRPEGYDAEHEIQAIVEEIRSSSKEEATWTEVFACKKPMVIGCGLMLFSASSGINSVIFYSSTIFSLAGFDNAIAATVAVGAINFIATAIATYLVDLYGRKTLLWLGTNLMNISLVLLAVILLAANSAGVAQGVIAVIAVLIYVVGFAIGLGAVSWVILSEIMSTRLRSKAFGLFVSINWGVNLVIGLLTLTAIEGLGGSKSSMDDEEQEDHEKQGVAYLYIIFALICMATTFFIYFYVPETKGKSPEDFNSESIMTSSENPIRSASESSSVKQHSRDY